MKLNKLENFNREKWFNIPNVLPYFCYTVKTWEAFYCYRESKEQIILTI